MLKLGKNEWRLVMDYCNLNAEATSIKAPMPLLK